MEKNSEVFWGLLRAGLWGKAYDCDIKDIDWKSVYLLAKKQFVTPIVTEGIAVTRAAGREVSIESQALNNFLRDVYSAEKKNLALNKTLADLSELLSKNGITPLQVKGQGYARDYRNPLRRMPGDIDFLLNGEDYDKAARLLPPMATKLDTEYTGIKHYGMFFGKSEVELHGTLHSHLSRTNNVLDKMQEELFSKKDFRFYEESGTTITIPSIDFDATFLFAHMVQHLYDFGLILKQFCDWTIFLHTHNSEINLKLLEQRLNEMGIMKEWKTLGCIVVSKLGLPAEEMPFFDPSFQGKSEMLWKAMCQEKSAAPASESKLHKKMRHLSERMSWLSGIWKISPSNTASAVGGILFGGTATFLKGE